jgi:ketosteroid isomerase-like protein
MIVVSRVLSTDAHVEWVSEGRMSRETIESFYRAFALRDAEAMAALYTDDVRFSDPAFGPLEGEHARNMWRMLAARATDLELTVSDVTDRSAHWEARYTFTQTGRRVHNIIDAKFEFRDGRIARHDDSFDFWRWSRQALGFAGLLLGWTALLQKAVRKRALATLAAWERSR